MDHKFIYNEPQQKVLSTIIDNLTNCDEFIFSVAFITTSGVSQLLPSLIALEQRGVNGKILAGTYLNFTEPHALRKLNQFKNIEIKLTTNINFHAKAYFFRHNHQWTSLVGSSNLTQSALTTNEEWNTLNIHPHKCQALAEMLSHFDQLWDKTLKLSLVIDDYEQEYALEQTRNQKEQSISNQLVTANKMQTNALAKIAELRHQKCDKALVVSATGSGKTILAAMAVQASNAKRILFIVHRENIAMAAKKTFERVINNPAITMGMYTGNQKEITADYLFATIQSVNNNLDQFVSEEFDEIIIDEVHHGGAASYQKVFNYFQPKFYLGLTATPERTDGFNIFAMFDYNLAFEYRLKAALEDQLLCPFHYFGVRDLTIDNQIIDEKATINNLTAKARVKHIVDTIKLYTSTSQINGLIFVSNTREAQELSQALNQYGFRTKALTNENSEADRTNAINQLETDQLDYIITVDIFNEGIDIPCVNQILLLRPTNSAIVYIQQIGRGLRKYRNKEYVTIIDFIGNYKHNYLIPIALSDQNTYDKDELKQNVILNGINCLLGASTIQFEEVLQADLIKQITNNNFSTMANIKHYYNYLQMKLNREPRLIDFYNNNMISPQVILNNDLYPIVKSKITKLKPKLNSEQLLYLEYISKLVYPAGRMHEIFIIDQLLKSVKVINLVEITRQFEQKYHVEHQKDIMENALDHLAKAIFQTISDEYKFSPFLTKEDGNYSITETFALAIEKEEFVAEVKDVLNVARTQYMNEGFDLNELLTINKMQHYQLWLVVKSSVLSKYYPYLNKLVNKLFIKVKAEMGNKQK